MVAHAPEEQLAELCVHAAPDALDVDGARSAPVRQQRERREGIEIRVCRRAAAEEDVVEDVRLEIDGEILADGERGLETEAEVRVRLAVVAAGADERAGKEKVARRIGAAPEAHVVEELAAHPQIAVRLEQVHPLLERFDRFAVLHPRLRVLLHPGRFLLHLVLGLLQLAADLLHHLPAELLLIERARSLHRAGSGRSGRGGWRRRGGRARRRSSRGPLLSRLRRAGWRLRLAGGRVLGRPLGLRLARRRGLRGRGLRGSGLGEGAARGEAESCGEAERAKHPFHSRKGQGTRASSMRSAAGSRNETFANCAGAR